MSCEAINRLAGCEVHFKCENSQKVGSFKARDARGHGRRNSVSYCDAVQRAGRKEEGSEWVRRRDHRVRAEPPGARNHRY